MSENHEHFTKTRSGAFVWSTQAECVKCGSGRGDAGE